MTTISGFPRAIQSAVIPGGPAGDHSVPGALNAGDDLISVRHISSDLVTNADLTAEFSIVAGTSNTINNDAGTTTADDFLIVTWAEAQ